MRSPSQRCPHQQKPSALMMQVPVPQQRGSSMVVSWPLTGTLLRPVNRAYSRRGVGLRAPSARHPTRLEIESPNALEVGRSHANDQIHHRIGTWVDGRWTPKSHWEALATDLYLPGGQPRQQPTPRLPDQFLRLLPPALSASAGKPEPNGRDELRGKSGPRCLEGDQASPLTQRRTAR